MEELVMLQKIKDFLSGLGAVIAIIMLLIAEGIEEGYIHHQWKKIGCDGNDCDKCDDCRHQQTCLKVRIGWD
jgi:hypothetical protein